MLLQLNLLSALNRFSKDRIFMLYTTHVIRNSVTKIYLTILLNYNLNQILSLVCMTLI